MTKDRKLDRLYRRFQERGDVSALGKVFDLAAPELLGIARHLCGDEAEAEDALQATFLAAIEKRAQYDPERRFLPWMIGILAHRAMEARRRAERVPDPARVPERAAPDPLAEASERELRERLGKTVEELPATYSGAIREYLVEGRSPSEIASALGISLNAAHVRIHRGLKLLRKALPPSFAVGSVLCLAPSRGLAAIRAQVLRHAEGAFPATVAGLSGSMGTAAVSIGVTAMTKKVALVGVLLAAGGSGYLWLGSSPGTGLVSTAPGLDSTVPGSTGKTVSQSPVADPADGATRRTEFAPRAHAVLTLVDSHRRAVPGAKAAVFAGEKILFAGAANERGEIAVPGNGEAATLLAIAPATAPHLEGIVLSPGRREVVLDEGAAVSGWILVDGRAPEEALGLSLSSERALLRVEGIPDSAWASLGHDPGGPAGLTQGTDESGAFRFAGLPEDWSGSLDLPFGYETASGGGQTLGFRAPVEGLRIELVRVPALVGRVVEPGGREPVPNPVVQASLTIVGEKDTLRMEALVGGTADEKGRFRVPISGIYQGFRRGIVTVSGKDGRGHRSIPFERAELPPGWDLGDVELATTRDLHFVVRDPSGRPVENAVALPDDDEERKSVPTDAEGRGLLRGASFDVSRIVVGALGYAAVEVPVPAAMNAPLVVTLPSSNMLEVLLRTPEGGVPPELDVALFSREPFFAGGGGWNPAKAHVAAGASRSQSQSVDARGGTRTFSPDGAGRARLCSLRPSLPLTLRVLDWCGFVVEERELPPLGEFETRVVEAVIRTRPRDFRGRVLDEEGRPLAGAQVRVEIRPFGAGVQTDATGSFRMEKLYADRARVTISSVGFVARAFEDLRIPEDGTPLEFRLTRGHQVVVSVEDEEGRPTSAQVRILGGLVIGVRPLDEGRYELSGLPADDVVIQARVGGRTYDVAHSPRIPEARIVVPVHGSVEVSLDPSFDLGDDETSRVVLIPKEGDLPRREAILFRDRIPEDRVLFPDVLPGSYEACVQRDLRKDGPPAADQREDLSRRVPVVVKPRERVEVSIRR
ncbi:MAG: sigma-70 family RNA polymerase sigma factor [Planctomycetes bacterium]|nr:sigma-70 family RNA polymerase sigma factor [Planctomycetota bacterium]